MSDADTRCGRPTRSGRPCRQRTVGGPCPAHVEHPAQDLGPAGQRLAAGVASWLRQHPGGPLELDVHEAAVLDQACATADRIAQLGQALAGLDLAADGAAVRLLAEERMQRTTLATLLLVRLGLPTGLAADVDGKGRSSTSRRAQTAARVRWEGRPARGVAAVPDR